MLEREREVEPPGSQLEVALDLARLFHKTGTQRQADLVRLAMGAFAPAAASQDGG